ILDPELPLQAALLGHESRVDARMDIESALGDQIAEAAGARALEELEGARVVTVRRRVRMQAHLDVDHVGVKRGTGGAVQRPERLRLQATAFRLDDRESAIQILRG